MSFIGTLEQLRLPDVLQRIEAHSKTGLLLVKQDSRQVELYFRDGKLMCIGPANANVPLETRLLQAGIISQHELQEALQTLGTQQPGETRLVITLMDMGYTSRDELRAWAMHEASAVISALSNRRQGAAYFEDDVPPPSDRLLVALSPATLMPPATSASQSVPSAPSVPSASALPAVPSPKPEPVHPHIPDIAPVVSQRPHPAHTVPASAPVAAQPATATPTTPAYISVSQLFADAPNFADVLDVPDSPLPATDALFELSPSRPRKPATEPTWITEPYIPPRIDTSFMRPEMVLLPADLSGVRAQNPMVQLTPDQWRLLTRVDGQTNLQMMSQALAMPSTLVCQVAGELIAQGLLRIMTPTMQAPLELSPASRDMITAGLGNGYIMPGAAAAPVQPWAAISPVTDALPPSPSYNALNVPFETVSQWGNGGNGATFVPGRGWVTGSQPLQPIQQSGPLYAANGMYIGVGGGR